MRPDEQLELDLWDDGLSFDAWFRSLPPTPTSASPDETQPDEASGDERKAA